jgi:hypothetical protein
MWDGDIEYYFCETHWRHRFEQERGRKPTKREYEYYLIH